MAKKVSGNFYKNGFDATKTSIKGTNIYSIGESIDSFSIQSNLEPRKVREIELQLNGFSEPISLETLKIEKDEVVRILDNNLNIFLNFDKTKVNNYAYFGSLKEFIRVSIEKIITTFPASLYITNEVTENVVLTVLNYSYNKNNDLSSFRIPTSAIDNKYNLLYTQKTFLFSSENDFRDISNHYEKYVVWNFQEEFSIIEFTGSTTPNSDYINLKVKGNPFPSASGGTGNIKFHIKPNYLKYEDFINGLENFEAYLLNRTTSPKYSASFKEPFETENGNIVLLEKVYTWKTSDGYNLDYDTSAYQDYLESLLLLGDKCDEYKTNLISRFLTTTSIKEFDTPDSKMDKLLKIYGREFDEVKIYIDGLANIAKTSYDKKDNIPDVLVKNFAKTLGWGTFTTATETDLMKSFLGHNTAPVFSGESKNHSPIETDIELWRRLIINSAYLFKSKGTRNAIDFLFNVMGAPKSLMDFNEYVYLVDGKLDINNYTNTDELNYAFDESGYPKILPNSSKYYFQMKGGWRSQVQFAPNNDKNLLSTIGVHKGDYDKGQYYYDVFGKFGNQKGFTLSRTADNIKSWVYTTTKTLRINTEKETTYEVQDSKLVLNTKEVSIFLDSAKAIENDVYEYNRNSDYVINTLALPNPYPNTILTQNEVSDLSFIEYVDLIYTSFINVQNRKVITDGHGGGYPTLRMLYEDYYAANSLKLDFDKVGKFIEMMDGFWISLLEQFIPSTTIWEGGKKYRNTVFDRQKFVYKHGENDGSEFRKEQPSISEVNVFISQINGTVNLPYIGDIHSTIKILSSFSTTMSFPDAGGEIIVESKNSGNLKVIPYITANTFTFRQPDYIMVHVGKISTGKTTPVIHNISLGQKAVNFIFSAHTELLGKQEKSETQFRYKVYSFDYNLNIFNENAVYKKITTNEFATQPNPVKTIDTIITHPFTDGDYLLKGSFIFSAETKQEFGYNFTPTAINIDTDVLNSYESYKYNLYDKRYDYWFTITSNPKTPLILTTSFEKGGGTNVSLGGSQLMNVSLAVTSEGESTFLINEKPLGKVWVNVNGNTLTESSTINFSDRAEYFITQTPVGISIKLANPLSVINKDKLSIIYLSGDQTLNNATIMSEIETIGGTTPSGSGALPGAKSYYNVDINKFEYYFKFKITPVILNSLIVVLNGNKLLNGIDYTLSQQNSYKIVFIGSLEFGDVLTMYYPTTLTEEEFYLTSQNFTAKWEASNGINTGLYTVEVATGTDTNFQTLLYSPTLGFKTGTTESNKIYDLTIANITTANASFIYRIKAEKYFYNMLGEKLITTVYSEPVKFKTDYRVSSF